MVPDDLKSTQGSPLENGLDQAEVSQPGNAAVEIRGRNALAEAVQQDVAKIAALTVPVDFGMDALYQARPAATVVAGIKVRRPHGTWWVRAHNLDAFVTRSAFYLIEDNTLEFGDQYIIGQGVTMTPRLRRKCRVAQLVLSVYMTVEDPAQHLFMWPAEISPDGRTDKRLQSIAKAILAARERPISVVWNKVQRVFEIDELPKGQKLPAPDFTSITIDQAVELVQQQYLINSDDHPLIKAANGVFSMAQAGMEE